MLIQLFIIDLQREHEMEYEPEDEKNDGDEKTPPRDA